MASSAAAVAVAAPNEKRERKYWTKEEDRILEKYIELNGERKWDQVSKKTGLCKAGKTGNSCRMRWTNHLDPKINTGPFSAEEDDKIIFLRNVIYGGNNKWSKIAERLPGRNDNQVKNRWHTHKLWDRPMLNEESIRNHYEKVFLQVDHEPMISKLEINQDLLDDEPDVNQQPFEESINTGGLSRVNFDQEILFDYTNAPDFNQFSLSDLFLSMNSLN